MVSDDTRLSTNAILLASLAGTGTLAAQPTLPLRQSTLDWGARDPGFKLELSGRLLLQHGLIDGNVEYQDAVRLVQRLMELGKDFEFVTYPVDQHGWQTRWARRDSQRRVMKLWEETILRE